MFGARVTTCWLDDKNMIELGITEDMLSYNDPARYKGSSYGRTGGKQARKEKYHGGKRRFTRRDRGSSSLFGYGREQSRSPSPIQSYRTQTSDHAPVKLEGSLSAVGTSAISEAYESYDRPSSFRYSLKSGDSQERPSSQLSDYSSQSGVREESAERSLSQASYGSRDSMSDGRRYLPVSEAHSSNHHKYKKRYESDSDDASSKERDPSQRSKYSDWYSRRRSEHRSKRIPAPVADKSSESDSKERDREEQDRWKKSHYRSRRSRESPRKTREHNDETRSKGDIQGVTKSPKTDANKSPVSSQGVQGDNLNVSGEARLDETLNQIQPMDLVTSENSSPEPEGCILPNKSPHEVKDEILQELQPNLDQESQVNNVISTLQIEPEAHSVTVPSSPMHRVFDFERDVTPPAEIVEATAEWYRTQNIPPNFDSISIQHVFQYYQNSVATGGTKTEDSLLHSPLSQWQTAQVDLGQHENQEQTATTDVQRTPIGNQSAQSQPCTESILMTRSSRPLLGASGFKSNDNIEKSHYLDSEARQQMEAIAISGEQGHHTATGRSSHAVEVLPMDSRYDESYNYQDQITDQGSYQTSVTTKISIPESSMTNRHTSPHGHSLSSTCTLEQNLPFIDAREGYERIRRFQEESSSIPSRGEKGDNDRMECSADDTYRLPESGHLHGMGVTHESRGEDITTHFVYVNNQELPNQSTPGKPPHDSFQRLHSGYNRWNKLSNKNGQDSCNSPDLVGSGYPQKSIDTSDEISSPSKLDTQQSTLVGISNNQPGKVLSMAEMSDPGKQTPPWDAQQPENDLGEGVDDGLSVSITQHQAKKEENYGKTTKRNSDECSHDISTLVDRSDETVEVQAVPFTKQQLHKYKYLQRSYYKVSNYYDG